MRSSTELRGHPNVKVIHVPGRDVYLQKNFIYKKKIFPLEIKEYQVQYLHWVIYCKYQKID